MSIDIVTQSSSLEVLQAFCVKHKLGKMVDGVFTLRKGLTIGPWGGDGKFPTSKATEDEFGNQLTAATYAAGFATILRFRDDFYIRVTKTVDGEQVTVKQRDNLTLDPEADNREQHMRSRIMRRVRRDGTTGKAGGVRWWMLDKVKFRRFEDVDAFLEAKGLPKFVRGGGNKP